MPQHYEMHMTFSRLDLARSCKILRWCPVMFTHLNPAYVNLNPAYGSVLPELTAHGSELLELTIRSSRQASRLKACST
jgi:hypothetical protein